MKKKIIIALALTGTLMAGGNLTPVEVNLETTGSEIYVDEVTGLMWQDSKYTDREQMAKGDKHSFGKVGKWKYARNHCQSISFAGYSDWRLPTKKELINVHKQMDVLNNIIDSDYWTSTPVNSKKAWAVYPIAESGFQHHMTDTHYFRCVRTMRRN